MLQRIFLNFATTGLTINFQYQMVKKLRFMTALFENIENNLIVRKQTFAMLTKIEIE